MTSLLKSKAKPIVKIDVHHNIVNGDDAQTLVTSRVTQALGAEVTPGSSKEDNRKIDLVLSLDHPWFKGEGMVIHAQVKSGNQYGKSLGDDGFKLYMRAKNEAKRISHSICVFWVDRNLREVYWALIHSKSSDKVQKYSRHHLVNPASRFDMARCVAKTTLLKKGGLGIILKSGYTDLGKTRKNAIEKYRSFKTLFSRNLGTVELTRIGWRHMFRKNRSSDRKKTSLEVIPYLDKILENNASSMYVSSLKFSKEADFEYRTSEYVLLFDKVKLYNKTTTEQEKIRVVIRVVEEVRWPINWKDSALLTQQIDQRLVLLSCYHKIKD
jgi:hypothetical protein